MSLYITPKNFTNQELGYQNKQLSLVKSDSTIDWDSYYVYLTQSEKETMSDFPQVMKIISETSQSPSDMIGLKKSDILCEKIHVLNKEYNEAITKYKDKLIISNGNDLKKINELSQSYKYTTLKVTVLGGFVGLVIGAIPAYLLSKKLVNDHIMYEGSRQRIAWLQKIDALEEERLKKVKDILTLSATKLVIELKEMEKNNDLVCTKKVLELNQIERIFKASFPGTSFDVRNGIGTENVSSLLTNINSKFLLTYNKSVFSNSSEHLGV